MIGVLFTIAAGVGIATYFLYFERDEAEVMNIKNMISSPRSTPQ